MYTVAMECLKVLVLMSVCVYSGSSSEKSSLQSYYEKPVIFERDFGGSKIFENFEVVWNVPTHKCPKNISFEKSLAPFGIQVNSGDKFTGEKIIILYDPGDFPITIKYENGTTTKHNGGIPQEGNLTKHLEAFEEVVKDKVPENFTGLGVIDFEVWRPIFRQHWNHQVIYRIESIDRERKLNSSLTGKPLNDTAAENFEKAAKEFMEKTLKLAKTLRPGALWGYYGFPYCYGFRVSRTGHCPPPVHEENDRITWLFNESTALYPSIYVSNNLTTEEQKSFYTGKLNEASRMVQKIYKANGKSIPVFPYFWFLYNNEDTFFTANDTYEALATTEKYKMGGLIVWGRGEDVDTVKKCDDLLKYMIEVFGPALQKVREDSKKNSKNPLKVLSDVNFNDITNEESSEGEEEEEIPQEEELIQDNDI